MDAILAVFRVIAPEFSQMTDAQVKAIITLYQGFVSKKTFGEKYNLAVAYITAHMIALNKLYTTTEGASTSSSIADIKREKEGDLEREYAVPNTDDFNSLLQKTYYGMMYLQILKMCVISVKTRFG